MAEAITERRRGPHRRLVAEQRKTGAAAARSGAGGVIDAARFADRVEGDCTFRARKPFSAFRSAGQRRRRFLSGFVRATAGPPGDLRDPPRFGFCRAEDFLADGPCGADNQRSDQLQR
jgi:hypothetical protein